ncbi:MAG TPA: hypothetical protein VL201_01160 [Patescibacteria group bacterium]|nr:hypothetical protein [Patescibacteria group bacterium]
MSCNGMDNEALKKTRQDAEEKYQSFEVSNNNGRIRLFGQDLLLVSDKTQQSVIKKFIDYFERAASNNDIQPKVIAAQMRMVNIQSKLVFKDSFFDIKKQTSTNTSWDKAFFYTFCACTMAALFGLAYRRL